MGACEGWGASLLTLVSRTDGTVLGTAHKLGILFEPDKMLRLGLDDLLDLIGGYKNGVKHHD